MSGRDVNSPVIGSRVTLWLCRAWGTAAETCLGRDKALGDRASEESVRRLDNRDMGVVVDVQPDSERTLE